MTQQPQAEGPIGGQRFARWRSGLEAYGAAHTLQELLTVKSDDVIGRVKTYEAIVKGENIPEPGVPEGFKVLIKELQSLCLDVKVLAEEAEVELLDDEDDVQEMAKELGLEIEQPTFTEKASAEKEEYDDEEEDAEEAGEEVDGEDEADYDEEFDPTEYLEEEEATDIGGTRRRVLGRGSSRGTGRRLPDQRSAESHSGKVVPAFAGGEKRSDQEKILGQGGIDPCWTPTILMR